MKKITVALTSWAVVGFVSLLVTSELLEMKSPWWGAVLWGVIMMNMVRPFMVSVPEYTKLVTVNLFNGTLEAYDTGLSWRFPWEQVKDGNYINTRLIPLEGEEDYPAKDGAKLHAKWQAPYRVVDAVTYIGVGRNAEKIISAIISGVLSSFIGKGEAEEIKEKQADAEDILKKKLQEELVFTTPEGEKFKYGIEVPVVTLADLDFDLAVQKARAAKAEARATKEIAKEFAGVDKDALEAAQVERGKASKQIFDVKGLDGVGAAAGAIASALKEKGGK